MQFDGEMGKADIKVKIYATIYNVWNTHRIWAHPS